MDDEICLKLLRQEIAVALGCTEPAAIGLAVAKSCETLGRRTEKVILYLSRNILKNAMGVGIPGTDRIGIATAAALAVVCGKSDYLLEVFKDVSQEDIRQAEKFISEGRIDIKMADTEEKLYIRAVCTGGNEEAETIIQKNHTNIVMIIHNGKRIYLQKEECSREPEKTLACSLTVKEICRFVQEVPLSELLFLKEAVDMNLAIAAKGLKEPYGLGVGRQIAEFTGESHLDMIQCAVATAAAAADARMAGCDLPVMSTTGSGNQGITATVPVAIAARYMKKSREEMLRAVAMSQLITIHIKSHLGRLSALCGCAIAAGIGASCGITWLSGGKEPQIESAIRNMVADISGLICDGAKYGCALKIATSVTSAFRSASLAVHNVTASENDGIVDSDVEQTIENLARLGNQGMLDTDRTILNMMLAH